jgi:spore germination protein GerM
MKPRILLLTQPLAPAEIERSFRSAVPTGSITDVQVTGGVATVDLATLFTEVPTVEQQLAFAQITYTLLQTPGVGQVAFTLDTVPIQAIDDEGLLLTRPATFEDYENLLAS